MTNHIKSALAAKSNVWKSWPHSTNCEQNIDEEKRDTIRLDMSVVIRLSPIAFDTTRRMLIGNFKRPLPAKAMKTSFQVRLSCCRHTPPTKAVFLRTVRRLLWERESQIMITYEAYWLYGNDRIAGIGENCVSEFLPNRSRWIRLTFTSF